MFYLNGAEKKQLQVITDGRNKMYIYGKNVAKEALKNNQVFSIILANNFADEEIIKMINSNISVVYKEKRELDKMVNGLHQGIILNVPDYKYCNLLDITNKENPFLVILDHIEDPHNFGAIIRTCEAASVDGIIIPKDRSVSVNSTVMKTSAGALENMKICLVTNLVNTIKELKKQGFWFIGTDMLGTDYKKIDYKGKIGIIIGSEGDGIGRLVKEECDFIASIPMTGKINSLNASVATAIIVYEAIDKRK